MIGKQVIMSSLISFVIGLIVGLFIGSVSMAMISYKMNNFLFYKIKEMEKEKND